ncbi:hypothetical protein [Corynebacterium dentalis]|uniref:hypothetical protein n=1 Tax=Corynebacterium dentalis TaxID=2014528 RepID=UPI00289927E7|nr:hypothetical protein [Corynebacterium dentalis]
MARIRTIKPEFWSSPGIEDLDPRWRLLFIAMWNWADDYGRGTAEPREIMGFAFPRDEEMTVGEFRRGLDGIRRVFGVKFYQVSKRPYYLIPSWEKHQKIDKRAKASRYPDPQDGSYISPLNGQVITTSAEDSEGYIEDSEGSAELSRNSGAGTGEKGNRGIGEQRLKDMSETSSDVPAPKPTAYPEAFETWWAAYPRHKNASKRKSLDSWRKAVKTISAERLLELTQIYASNPGVDEVRLIPHPTTWLNEHRWESIEEHDQAPRPQTQPGRGYLPSDWLFNEPPIVDAEIEPPPRKELAPWETAN